jgi:pilus assembly protein CpaB
MREEGQNTRRDGTDVVTLLVTPPQAEQIALASSEGHITLMLRNPLDVAEPLTPGARLAGLVDGPAAEAPQPRRTRVRENRIQLVEAIEGGPVAVPPPAAAPPVYTFEAIRAGKRTMETIQ